MTRAGHRVLLLALTLTGCSPAPGDTSDTADAAVPPATFSEIHVALFPQETAAKCDSCHGQPASQISNGLLFMGADDRDTAYAAIVGPESTSRDCAGNAYVVPGEPDESLFYLKLLDDTICGERMPLGGGALPGDQIEMVRSWIEAGAADD